MAPRSWTIHGRAEITALYEILDRIGSGTYSDVYRARRRADARTVALKEIHDRQSAHREIEALLALRSAPNIVELIEYFFADDEDDAVLVLEFLPVDLASVITQARDREGGVIPLGEIKRWMLQILTGIETCHKNWVVHRDLKPSNLMISPDGVLKIIDFGQSRILHDAAVLENEGFHEQDQTVESWLPEDQEHSQEANQACPVMPQILPIQEEGPLYRHEYLKADDDGVKAGYTFDDMNRDMSFQDGEASCLATCSSGDIEDDPFRESLSYEGEDAPPKDDSGLLTSCVGTRWFKAPELLYGSTSYGLEVDLWSLGCIFAELLSLQHLFPGLSDIDQLAKIINVLGNIKETNWPGCSKLPDYDKISFVEVENPCGLEVCLTNRSSAEINIVKRLICFDPARRATATELLQDKFFQEEPLPVPLDELRFPETKVDSEDNESNQGDWYRDRGSDSDFEEFGNMDVTNTEKGFSIKFL